MKGTLSYNLMMIQKIIIFTENLVDEDIDFEIFSIKIIQDIQFIASTLNSLYNEFLKNVKHYSNDNLLKIYYFCIKRFYRMLSKISKNKSVLDSDVNFQYISKELKIDLENRLEHIRNFNCRAATKELDKQCINEDEYSILLKTID